jgi:hypothetical protein
LAVLSQRSALPAARRDAGDQEGRVRWVRDGWAREGERP